VSSARPPRALRIRRWLRRLAIAGCAVVFMSSGLLAIYISRPQSGPAHALLDAIESPIRQNDGLQYNVHRALGKMFSLCPCTAGLSADQYRRASFHRSRGATPAQ
jgi:hypothetical protein